MRCGCFGCVYVHVPGTAKGVILSQKASSVVVRDLDLSSGESEQVGVCGSEASLIHKACSVQTGLHSETPPQKPNPTQPNDKTEGQPIVLREGGQ